MSRTGWLFILLALITGCSSGKEYDKPIVVIETKFGDITLELYTEEAPATAKAFLDNADRGIYKDASFYRILRDDNQVSGAPKSHLIQGGIWHTNFKLRDELPNIPHETTEETGILHKEGVISLARSDPGTAKSEFFICLEDEPGFDYGGDNNHDGLGYAAFGKVIAGMETVRKIYERPEHKQSFYPPVAILNVRRGKRLDVNK